VFVTLLCLTDKLVYVEMAELRYPSHLHHSRASVAESVSVNSMANPKVETLESAKAAVPR
jgi:hypothetical protein